jgi:hypothetical protein
MSSPFETEKYSITNEFLFFFIQDVKEIFFIQLFSVGYRRL